VTTKQHKWRTSTVRERAMPDGG